MTVTWTLTLAGLQHTPVVLRDREEARKLLQRHNTKRVADWPVAASRAWEVYTSSGYLGCVICRVDRRV